MEKEKIITIVLVVVLVLAVGSIIYTYDFDEASSLDSANIEPDSSQGTVQLVILENTGSSSSSGGENE